MKTKSCSLLLGITLFFITHNLYADSTSLILPKAESPITNAFANSLQTQPTESTPSLLPNEFSSEIKDTEGYQFNETSPVLLTLSTTNTTHSAPEGALDLKSIQKNDEKDYSNKLEEFDAPAIPKK